MGGTARMAIRMTEDQLRRAHQVLSDLLSESDQERTGAGELAWYEPPVAPSAFGANLSATDLLSWWFRLHPESGETAGTPILDNRRLQRPAQR